MKARSIRAGSNPAGSRGADQGAKDTTKMKKGTGWCVIGNDHVAYLK